MQDQVKECDWQICFSESFCKSCPSSPRRENAHCPRRKMEIALAANEQRDSQGPGMYPRCVRWLAFCLF